MSLQAAYEAVGNGNINALAKINLNPFINNLYNKQTLLHVACMKGNLEIVKLLLNVSGIDVNKQVSISSNNELEFFDRL